MNGFKLHLASAGLAVHGFRLRPFCYRRRILGETSYLVTVITERCVTALLQLLRQKHLISRRYKNSVKYRCLISVAVSFRNIHSD